MSKYYLSIKAFRFIWSWAMIIFMVACSTENEPMTDTDNFDRQVMLVNWADNIIIPGYENYVGKVTDMVNAKNVFLEDRSTENFDGLKNAWLEAYIAWQSVSMFEIGKAEELSIRDYTNVYPTDNAGIEDNVNSESYDLNLPSLRDQQGFPALDYLLYGSAENSSMILARFEAEENLRNYLNDLITRLSDLSTAVLQDWEGGYRDEFINNDGSTASSSVNKLVNDYLFYYEKALRAGKIGIPAGVFSNTPLSNRVEAFYKQDVSKTLFMTSLNASIDFFNGRYFNGNGQGESLKSYLDFLNSVTDGSNLSDLINDQFTSTKVQAESLGEDFYAEVENNNDNMLQTYDELQTNTILLKVDMFQALNIQVDYVDADGD
ncbi:imelysin family protein [Flexithrix dorotheae]|uniref:imelysin family protein n=1 Tax=Flexithrix dorotheae TaxID=70993 RepID=UPI001B7F88D2|nr:imelysin family protein [Flexithrix dorotheae]